MVVWEIPVGQQFVKNSDQPVWHRQPRLVQSHLNHLLSPFWCSIWTWADCLGYVYRSKCIELLSRDWLIIYSRKWAVKQVYLIKWPTSVTSGAETFSHDLGVLAFDFLYSTCIIICLEQTDLKIIINASAVTLLLQQICISFIIHM